MAHLIANAATIAIGLIAAASLIDSAAGILRHAEPGEPE